MWDNEGNRYVIHGIGDDRHIIGKDNVKFALDSADSVFADDGFPCDSEYINYDPTGGLGRMAVGMADTDTDADMATQSTTSVRSATSPQADENKDADMDKNDNKSEDTVSDDSESAEESAEEDVEEEDSEDEDAGPPEEWIDLNDQGTEYTVEVDEEGMRYIMNTHDEVLVEDNDTGKWVRETDGLSDFGDYHQILRDDQKRRYYRDNEGVMNVEIIAGDWRAIKELPRKK
jgi:hypothetical protein